MGEHADGIRYLEDLNTGQTATYGRYVLTADEIVTFARQYDPQPFHIDEAQAQETRFEGLIASGWHTACIAMRLVVLEGFLSDVAVVAGVGVENLRWTAPVRPGDALTVREEVLDTRSSASDPSLGILRIAIEVLNQDDEIVLSMIWIDLVERRPDSRS